MLSKLFSPRIFEGELLWRLLSDLWTYLLLVFVIINFFSKNHYEFLIVPFAVLYTGILTIYVGTKEFDRWYEAHRSRHPGEWFVLAWTVVMVVLMIASSILGEEYAIHSDIVAVYIAVLSLFALTQKSKKMHLKKLRDDRAEEAQ